MSARTQHDDLNDKITPDNNPDKVNRAASYQRNIVQDEAEGGGSFRKVLAHLPRHQFSLGDELPGIKPSLKSKVSH